MDLDVDRNLAAIDKIVDTLHAVCEKIDAVRVGAQNTDRDIAVNVDGQGQLVGVWLRPGILDSKRPAVIARELTALLRQSGNDAIAETHAKAEAAIQYPAVAVASHVATAMSGTPRCKLNPPAPVGTTRGET